MYKILSEPFLFCLLFIVFRKPKLRTCFKHHQNGLSSESMITCTTWYHVNWESNSVALLLMIDEICRPLDRQVVFISGGIPGWISEASAVSVILRREGKPYNSRMGGGAFLGSNTNLHWSIKLIPVEVNDMVNIPLGSKESLESRSYHHYLPRFRKYLQTCLRTLPKKKRHHPHSHHPPKVLWWDAGPQHTAKLPTSCFASTTGRRGEKEYTPEI